jgi:molecular chaperone DnaK
MAVVGIDLGTTNSVVAAVKDGRVVVVPDADGHRLHPSVVALLPNGAKLYSHQATARRVLDPGYTIFSAKRLIGQSFRSDEVRMTTARVPYQVREGSNEQPVVVGPDRAYTIPEISGLMLAYLKHLAEAHLKEPVTAAVVTVPANFNDAQRRATIDAGRIGGLEVLRVVNEPTAAALAYGFGRNMSQRIAIYDFGGGTFDVTVLQVEGEVFEVIATGGDSFLGGDDADSAIVNLLSELYVQQLRTDPRQLPAIKAHLTLAAEQIKRRLSEAPEARGDLKLGVDGRGQPTSLKFHISRQAFEAAIAPLVARTIRTADEVINRAGFAATQIDEVILVGGSTRIPAVRRDVERHFGKAPRADINPDEVVAWGAALQAASLAGGGETLGRRPVLLDVTPRGLGIAVAGGFCETIVDRNVPVPVEQMRVFTTSADHQTKVVIQVCQGESQRFDENDPLGDLALTDLPDGRRGEVKIEVTFRVDTNGILRVRARDPESGKESQAAVNVRATMSDGEVSEATQRQQDEKAAAPKLAPGKAPPPA